MDGAVDGGVAANVCGGPRFEDRSGDGESVEQDLTEDFVWNSFCHICCEWVCCKFKDAVSVFLWF